MGAPNRAKRKAAATVVCLLFAGLLLIHLGGAGRKQVGNFVPPLSVTGTLYSIDCNRERFTLTVDSSAAGALSDSVREHLSEGNRLVFSMSDEEMKSDFQWRYEVGEDVRIEFHEDYMKNGFIMAVDCEQLSA